MYKYLSLKYSLFVAAAVYLQALDLVVGQVGLVIDLLEVNVGVGIGLGHDEGFLI